MPAYSHKEFFVPFLMDGTKKQTVRARRKYPPKVGQVVYNYYGLGTKHQWKINEATINNVQSVLILDNTIFLFDDVLESKKLQDVGMLNRFVIWGDLPPGRALDDRQKNQFAWQEGFRPQGSTFYSPGDAFNLMMQYWSKVCELPFIGDVIYW